MGSLITVMVSPHLADGCAVTKDAAAALVADGWGKPEAPTNRRRLCEDQLMDDFYIQQYMREIVIQAESVMWAVESYNQALQGEGTPRHVVGAAQAITNASIAITRLLWPNPTKKGPDGRPANGMDAEELEWAKQRGRTLRHLLRPITEQASPLGYRKIRNAFEHFDEYLDKYLVGIERGVHKSYIVDMNVGPRNMVVIDGEIPTHLRLVDNSRHEVWVLDASIEIQPLVEEVDRVAQKAREWLEQHSKRGSEAVGA